MSERPLQTHAELSADVSRLVDDLEKETDRGAALMGAAFLNDVLDLLIRSAFLDDAVAADKLLGEGRALESFGSRAHLAYLIGLLGTDVYGDINLIGEIRNDFAGRHPASFEKEEIRDKARKLQCVSVFYTDDSCSPRERFTVSVVVIANHMLVQAQSQRRASPGKRFVASGVLRLK